MDGTNQPTVEIGTFQAPTEDKVYSHPLTAAVAAYEEHLGLSSCPEKDSPGGPDPRNAKNGVPRTEAANGDSPSDTVSVSATL